ncbi:MAG TPA: YopT-type cysteine protease domain-containing protein [Paraburkholderia sp.]|uniref:YopT-type cysteine protease domain-containing protein n=1 Tax=Paraburkholderia sp. TaxID=1926495 RepID=UPI002B463E16|nr:YopT-type cysteine protease domain-containing protein [Paraburkholderia sp.]HKR44554.1 YopT-type cysteine protease domain-containing protein [Paraburkholderia sp.]
MPFASLAQGATELGGENIFFEKQSTIRNYVGNSTVADQLKKGICLSLVLQWLSSDPEIQVVAGVARMISATGAQDVFVHNWTGTADVSAAGRRKLAQQCKFWFEYEPQPFTEGKHIDRSILDSEHASGKDARFILCIQTAAHDSAHALGIRKKSDDQNVYFYDPNYGCVRLPKDMFDGFLAKFIESFYNDYAEWYISAFLPKG